MTLSQQLGKHLKDVHFGGNWTVSNMRDQLKDVTWQQATAKVEDFNTIATLAFHTWYFVAAQLKVLQGDVLDSKDELSFDHPPINSRQDWENLQNRIWSDVETIAGLIEQLPDSKLSEEFVDRKYGTYFRNISGLIEHTHYHLGQMALIKKTILNTGK